MRGFSAGTFGNLGNSAWKRALLCRSSKSASAGASTSPAAAGHPILKAALTSGALSLAGDLLAQAFTIRSQKKLPGHSQGIDPLRAARMGSFGLFFYGPYQHIWYKGLDRFFPTTSISHLASKVFLNQTALGPVVLSAVLLWNYTLTRQLHKLPEKARRDFVPTLINGWKFWLPASVVNFYLVPLRYRVLFMSTCGVFWTGYLSYTSN